MGQPSDKITNAVVTYRRYLIRILKQFKTIKMGRLVVLPLQISVAMSHGATIQGGESSFTHAALKRKPKIRMESTKFPSPSEPPSGAPDLTIGDTWLL